MGLKKIMGNGITLVAAVLIVACGAEKRQDVPTLAQPSFSSYKDYRDYVKNIAAEVARIGNVTIDKESLLAGDQSDVLKTIENLYSVHKKYDMKLRGYVEIKFATQRQATNTGGVVVLNYGATEEEIEKFLSSQPTQAELEKIRVEAAARKRLKEQEDAARAAQAAEQARRQEEENRPRRSDFGRP